MNSTRRSFLRGALSLSVVAVAGIPALALADVPRIVGDGVHDDTAGLQALFDRKPFAVEGQGFIAEDGILHGGVFRVTKTLVLRGEGWTIRNCTFWCDQDADQFSIFCTPPMKGE